MTKLKINNNKIVIITCIRAYALLTVHSEIAMIRYWDVNVIKPASASDVKY